MTLSLLAALATAVCYGSGSVLQALGSRRATEPDAEGRVHGLLGGLVRQLPFVAGLGLDAAGLALSVYALRRLPLFVVQAAVASSVAVTAIVAMVLLGARLGRLDWFAIGAVVVGLGSLAAASGVERPVDTSVGLRLTFVAGGALLALAAWLLVRAEAKGSAQVLGAVAGLAYGLGALSVRVILGFAPADLVRNPATLSALLGGGTGILTFAVALRRGSVTAATGALTAAETVVPSLIGLLVLGERPRAGGWPLAVLGFALAVGGAFALSRFGEAAEAEI